MSDKRISDLPEDINITGGENLVTEEQGGNFRVSLLVVKDWVLTFVNSNSNIDGGSANSVYLSSQVIDGGNA